MHADKRSSSRYPSENEATVTIELTAETESREVRTFNCRTADVSLRGVRLKLDLSLPVNAEVQVKVKLGKTAHQFDHTGRVAWCSPDSAGELPAAGHYSAGIEFTTRPGPTLDAWRYELFALIG